MSKFFRKVSITALETPPLIYTGLSSPQTLTITSPSLVIMNSTALITLNLPANPNPGQRFTIINYSNKTLTIDTNNGGNFFDGSISNNKIFMGQFDKVQLIFYGNQWFTV